MRGAPVSVSDLTELLVTRANLERSLLIGIDGLAGSGKSTLARLLLRSLNNNNRCAALLRFDDFQNSEQKKPIYFRNGDLESTNNDYGYNWNSIRENIIEPTRRNSSIPCCKHRIQTLIVEGTSCLRLQLKQYYDIKIYLTADRPIRLKRVSQRDGSRFLNWYKIFWFPEEEHYKKFHFPEKSADLIIDTSAVGEGMSAGIYLVRQKIPTVE
jgi:uridine kinase